MITKKQRKFYSILVGILFIFGAIIYGLLAYFANFSPLIIYILLGGSLLGGLASGGILFGRYIAQSNSIVLKALSIIFLPIALFIIMIIGVFPLIPYYIYNLVKYIKTRKKPDQISIPLVKPKKSLLTIGIGLSTLLVLALIQYMINGINEANIAEEIYTKTGYPAGSPDNVIIRHFFYSDKSTDYASNMEYDYKIIDEMLFSVTNNNGQYRYKVFCQNPDKSFSKSDNYQCYINLSGKNLHHDLDELFSYVSIMKKGNSYAYMLLIDARNDDEHIADIASGFSSSVNVYSDPELIQVFLDKVDRIYADPEKIKLCDINGVPIERIELDNGKYVAFCDTMLSSDTDYLLTVVYNGKTYSLLTYERIANLNIGSIVPIVPTPSPSHTSQP